MSSKKYSTIQSLIQEEMVQYCFSGDIYAGAELTPFAKTTIQNPLFLNNPDVKEVIILSRNLTSD